MGYYFIYGKNLGLQRGGKTLFVLKDYAISGPASDGKRLGEGKVESFSCSPKRFDKVKVKINEWLDAAVFKVKAEPEI